MIFNKYYEDELAYLRGLGAAFGRANPAIAGMLSRQAADPDVERLLEGFAFLTGRLRQRLDEELPELSHGMLALLWPHYLRPIPALSIVELLPDIATVVPVPRGAAVAAAPVDGLSCRFRICRDTAVLPARIAAVRLEERARSATLAIQLDGVRGAPIELSIARKLRVFLNGERDSRLGMRLLRSLMTDVARVEVTDGQRTVSLAPSCITHGGFDRDDGTLPWPENSAPGYRILQEYLAFPDLFLFVDLPALAEYGPFIGSSLTISFHMIRRPDLPTRISAEHLRLNCVPVINLFNDDSRPIVPDRGRTEYRLVATGAAANHATVYSIDAVQGSVQGQATRITYHPFESFRQVLRQSGGHFYRARLRPTVTGTRCDMWISFVDGGDRQAHPAADVISASLTCTDGRVAELVPIGGISRPAVGSPASMSFRNITAVTPEVPPPIQGDSLWRLVAGLARSLRGLGDIGTLRALIAAHDFRSAYDDQQRRRLDLLLDALQDIKVEPIHVLVEGIPARGQHIVLTLNERGLGGSEGAFLFGAVLNGFLDSYVNPNTCYRLSIHGVETKVAFDWPLRAGRAELP